MRTEDAKKRREDIETKGLAKVITSQEHSDTMFVQCHPKGTKGTVNSPGSVMPELDSHAPSANNPTPLESRFSPWHACGSDHKVYHLGMRRSAHFSLEGCILRLPPGDYGHEAAARQWEETFGVTRSRDLLAFTNARMGFVPGQNACPEGLVSITVGVKGQTTLNAILQRARRAEVSSDGNVSMCGVRWNFVLTGHGDSKLQAHAKSLSQQLRAIMKVVGPCCAQDQCSSQQPGDCQCCFASR
ncbi:uncharacterized protein M421DRAFT_77685 [Didymella exigua CBS 183.55]|uniref:Uncharacterized protein n=1 Tax=Didymella exigua CBS 183.55 TaxID=1150837 RepID=A0A6A5R7C1_9PLEO|nr:uncharacterized protein M421DRAFT_77685 [Didymella exigua CBS 183.55]KAF1922606.1 hypothetical protein M421DRAFT_77685 [Didymella exigua CBS 183.55]